jgi:uncharacterized iron-regulated membrane protein
MAQSRASSLTRPLHRRLGPWIAAFILIQAVSGTIIVFRDEWAALHAPPPAALSIGVDAIIERARALDAGILVRLDLPSHSQPLYVATYRTREGATRFAEIAADGSIVSHGARWRYPLRALAAFHHDWLLGQNGARVQSALGVAALVTMTAGFIAWWPGTRRVRKVLAHRPKSNRSAALYWIHSGLAFLTLPLTIVMVVSGLLIADRGDLQPLISAPPAVAAPVVRMDVFASHAAMIARAEQNAPGMTAHDLRFLPGRLLVVLRTPESLITGRVWLRTDTGEVLSAQHRDNADRGTAIYDFLLRLHDGEWLGIAGKTLAFTAGFSLVAVAALGVARRLSRTRKRSLASAAQS